MEYEFKGLIIERDEFSSGDGIYILNSKGKFGEPFAQAFPSHSNVSVRFAIGTTGEWPETLDEVAADDIMRLEGQAKANYYDRYSDLTGYLWTEENCKVGGHDLLRVLQENVGKYLWMEVKVHPNTKKFIRITKN